MPRFFALLTALALCAPAHAQVRFGSVPAPAAGPAVASSATAQEIQLIAPQLVGFAGSNANFEALVAGLAQGTPITSAGVQMQFTSDSRIPAGATSASRILGTSNTPLSGSSSSPVVSTTNTPAATTSSAGAAAGAAAGNSGITSATSGAFVPPARATTTPRFGAR